MFGFSKYSSKPPVLSDRAICLCVWVRAHVRPDRKRRAGRKRRWRCEKIVRARLVSRRREKGECNNDEGRKNNRTLSFSLFYFILFFLVL